MNSFIVEFWARIFSILNKISIFTALRSLLGTQSYRWVDIWVVAHTALAVSAVFIVGLYQTSILALLLTVYGLYRVFEINVYQINVLLFDEYRAKQRGEDYAVRGYLRTVVLLLHNYVEVIFWFACSYIYFAEYFTHKWGGGTIVGGLYSSFIVMSTFGDFNLTPKFTFAAIILLYQSASGLFMILLSIARFIAVLPHPETLDDKERRPRIRRARPARQLSRKATR